MVNIFNNQKELSLILVVPLESQTDTSAALVWEKPEESSRIDCYEIYLDNVLYDNCKCTDYTVKNLSCEYEYEVFVQAILKNSDIKLESNHVKVNTKRKADIFDITTFGAVGDGKTLNTEAIQDAINACNYGGKVYVPKGEFLTGALFLKSNMTLYIDNGGVILGSDDTTHYPLIKYRFEGLETLCYASLINTEENSANRLENINISGPGKIDANGSNLRANELMENKGKPGRALCMRNVDNVYLHEITVKHSPAWCVHLIYCNQVCVNEISIYTKHDELGTKYKGISNGDGLNPDSTSNVYIFHSMIASQDDCIAIKSGRDSEGRTVGKPSENIRITNCRFNSGFGVAVGSEMSGDVRNVLVQDCTFDDVYSVASIKAPRGRGGIIENIKYEDILFKNYSLEHEDCEWFRGAIYIDQFYSHISFDADKTEEVNEGTSIIRNISFKNINLDTMVSNAIYMTGLPESPLENIQLTNIHAIGKYGLKAINISGLEFNNVTVDSREDEAFSFHNVVGMENI